MSSLIDAVDWAKQEIYSLKQQLVKSQKETAHWKANHDHQVEAARILKQREDLPLERIEAYSRYLAALKDQERYQWLRHGDNDERVLCKISGYTYLPRNKELDIAIDIAMKEQHETHRNL